MSDKEKDTAAAFAESSKAMDDAAKAAFEDLNTCGIDPKAIKAVGGWWARHYGKAGHKRLAKILLLKVKS